MKGFIDFIFLQKLLLKMHIMRDQIEKAAQILIESKHTTVFTGAGISVESGIPPFRGENGLWNKYNPIYIELDYFYKNPVKSWEVIKEIFYDFFGKAVPNAAHKVCAELERKGIVKAVITQNIDNLHQEAGSKIVYEFHGNSHSLICTKCNSLYKVEQVNLKQKPPSCSKCGGLLKPDFIFFGEGIPQYAYNKSMEEAEMADVFLVIGTTGEIMPACMIPQIAKQNRAKIIEVNPEASAYTHFITDIYLKGKAGEVMDQLYDQICNIS